MMEIPIQVAVRVRPLLPTDRLHEVVCVDAFSYANQIVLGNQKCFTVNYALPMDCSQSQLFVTTVYPLINRVLEGFDISVIAYGQSGSGKTYTILGPGLHCALSETEYGIIPRVTREIFSRMTQTPGRRFKVTVSFIEIYDEGVRDLLNTSQFRRKLIIVENQEGTTVVVGAEEIECQSISEVFNCLHVGMSNRQVGWATVQQLPYRRSHSLFTLTLEQQWIVDGVIHHRCSKAQFTDLGGSEKSVLLENGGHFISESLQLDCGLVALGNVISTLTEPQWQHMHVPYTQSVLTRLLKSSFGGKATTLVIGCISPASLDFDETLNSLIFLTRIQGINNNPVMNVGADSNDHELNAEIMSEERYTEVLDSEERSTNADTFGLEFAASQWLKLVANAEDLFSKLVTSKYLSRDEKDQIERWLCLKQECEECVGSDDTTSCRGFEGRMLERIDEITESEETSENSHEGSSLKMKTNCSKNMDEKTNCESETESEQDSQHPDFLEKLDDLIKKFKYRTDGTVRNKRDSYIMEDQNEKNDVSEHSLDEERGEETLSGCHPSYAPFVSHKSLGGRRKSIQPGTNLPNIVMALNCARLGTPLKEAESVTEESCQVDCNIGKGENYEAPEAENHPTTGSIPDNVAEAPPPPPPVPCQELRMLSAGTEARQSQFRQVLINLEGAQKRIEKLQYTIQIKEQFIGDMEKNSETRSSAKQRFQRKRSQLEDEYYKTRTHLAQAENALLLAPKDSDLNEEKLQHKKEIEKYKHLALHYEKRLKDIEMIKQIAGDSSARKVRELENSLQNSKMQMEKLKKQLKKQEQHKQCLEQELLEDQRKMKELEQKCNLQTSKLNEKDASETTDDERLRWIQEEEERIVGMRESSQRLREQLLQQRTMLDKREAFMKEKVCLEKCKTKSIREVSARVSHLEQVLKEKSTDLEKAEDLDEKEALRHEIQGLRKTKEFLLEQRCGLDEKFQKDKRLSTVEETKMLEFEEAIEAIDALIEYKNELICGRKGQGLDNSRVEREKGEKLLWECLMKLSPMEMRTLVYKYFQKVIDLRENGRKMEVQLAETEDKAIQMYRLINGLQQSHYDAERHIVVLQKKHQEELHIMLRHFAEESSGSSGAEAATCHLLLDRDAELRKENKRLKKRLQELEMLLKRDSVPTAKVTRQKNKIIIHQPTSPRKLHDASIK